MERQFGGSITWFKIFGVTARALNRLPKVSVIVNRFGVTLIGRGRRLSTAAPARAEATRGGHPARIAGLKID